MFTVNHFIWLGICALLIALLLFLALKFKWNFKTANLVMVGISIVSELTKIFTHIRFVNGIDYSDGGFITASALPFHLCSILIFFFFFMALSKNEKHIEIAKKFFVPIGLIGSIFAIAMATSGVDFKEPYAYQAFLYHASMLWFAIYLIVTKQIKLNFKDFIRNIIMLAAIGIIVLWIDGALRTSGCDTVNFFFLVEPPMEGLPFLNLNYGWHVYFIHLSSLAIILEFLVTLPFILKERKHGK